MSQAQIVKIDGKQYWVGLEWEVIAQSEHPKKRLHELRQEFGRAGIYLMHQQSNSGVVALGYANILADTYRKAPSLAAIIAYAKREPWMGIYQIGEDLWWYIAVREGQAVIPGGDVIGTREEVEAARAEHQGIGDWRDSVEGKITDNLNLIQEGLLQGGGSANIQVARMVAQISHPRRVIFLILALSIGFSSLLYLHHLYVQTRLKRQAITRAARIATARQMLAEQILARRNQEPWVGKPRVYNVINGCLTTLRGLPLERTGWAPATLVCLPNGDGKVLWRRASYGLASKAPPGTLKAGGNQIIESISVHISKDKRVSTHPLAEPELMRKLYGISQFAGETIRLLQGTLSAGPGLPGAKKRKNKSPSPESFYRSLQVVVGTKGLIGEAAAQAIALFGSIPTMTITKIVISDLPNHPSWKASLRVWVQQ